MYSIHFVWVLCSMLIMFNSDLLEAELCLSQETLQAIFYTMNVITLFNVVYTFTIQKRLIRYEPLPPYVERESKADIKE